MRLKRRVQQTPDEAILTLCDSQRSPRAFSVLRLREDQVREAGVDSIRQEVGEHAGYELHIA